MSAIDAPLVCSPIVTVLDEVTKGGDRLPPRLREAWKLGADAVTVSLSVSDMKEIPRHVFSPG
jgi:hypothetical protein